MKNTIIILFICLGVGCSVDTQKMDKTRVEKLLQLAEKSDSAKDLNRSISYYTEILNIDSTNLEALINRGRALLWDGKSKAAIADYDKAVNLYANERTFYARGIAYTILNEYDKALRDIKRSLELNPDFGDGYFGLSIIKEAEGDLTSALTFCDKAETYNYPRNELQERRASIYEKQGEYQAAIDILTILIQTNPKTASYYNNRGHYKNELHQYAEAIVDLEEAILLDPSMAFAYNNKAFALLKEGRATSALNDVNTSLKLNAENPYALRTRGEIYLSLSRKTEACSDFDHAQRVGDDKLRKELVTLKEKACKN